MKLGPESVDFQLEVFWMTWVLKKMVAGRSVWGHLSRLMLVFFKIDARKIRGCFYLEGEQLDGHWESQYIKLSRGYNFKSEWIIFPLLQTGKPNFFLTTYNTLTVPNSLLVSPKEHPHHLHVPAIRVGWLGLRRYSTNNQSSNNLLTPGSDGHSKVTPNQILN